MRLRPTLNSACKEWGVEKKIDRIKRSAAGLQQVEAVMSQASEKPFENLHAQNLNKRNEKRTGPNHSKENERYRRITCGITKMQMQ